MNVAAIRLQIEDGVADELTGPVIRHVAAAPALEQIDAARRQLLRRFEDVRSIDEWVELSVSGDSLYEGG